MEQDVHLAPRPAPHLILVGPMGAGKTAIGRRLAERLGLRFVDLDAVVEARAGARVSEIFAREGEAGFRARERDALNDTMAGAAAVVASGGGAVLSPENRRAMRSRGFVVHLSAGVDTQLQRLARDRTRPLLEVEDRAGVLRTLAAERGPLYAEIADLVFATDGMATPDAADAIAGLLQTHWRQDTVKVVDVAGASPYRIAIGDGLLRDGAALAAHVRGRHVVIVSDAQVAPLYARDLADTLQMRLPDARVIVSCIPAGEASKTLERFGELMRELADFGATRDACIVALGGGVVGDLAGFAAACWMRGIDCVQVPTTLLAMVDSSVGGKTAVDLPQGKNLVGAFHPPRAVFADTATLRTLPDRELRAGLAEVVKYGAIRDAAFLDWLEAHADALLAREPTALAEAIARSCAHKAAIVERDPLERGERALLNFGHTFAHAIESEQGYGGLNHGEAVAVGMVCAAHLSARLRMAPITEAERLSALLARFGLPVALPAGLDPGALVARMRLDKKATAGALRFVLWRGAGQAEITAGVEEGDVIAAMQALPSVPVPPPPVQSPSP